MFLLKWFNYHYDYVSWDEDFEVFYPNLSFNFIFKTLNDFLDYLKKLFFVTIFFYNIDISNMGLLKWFIIMAHLIHIVFIIIDKDNKDVSEK